MQFKGALLVLSSVFFVACSGSDEQNPLVLLEEDANSATNNANSTNNTNSTNNQTNNASNNANVGPRMDLEVVYEGTIEANGSSQSFTFDVPDDAISVSINAVSGAPTFVTLAEWKQGDGTDAITNNWFQTDMGFPQICLSCPQRITAAEGAFSAAIPGNQTVELVAGTHTARLFAFTQNQNSVVPWMGDVEVYVVVKRGRPEPTTGSLDVNLWFTGANGLSATTAPDDAEFQQMLADVDTIYAQSGFQLGRIRYYDVPNGATYQVIEDAGQPGSALTTLFKTSEGAEHDAVNVFFCDELMVGGPLGGFGVLLGIAGGIPGPTHANGTDRSGVALAVKRTPQVPTPLYKVFAHEVGHYLGLYHTSEQNLGFGPQIHDQLNDTGENDTTLLMHAAGNGDTLSESQGRVVRHNPWVRTAGGQ